MCPNDAAPVAGVAGAGGVAAGNVPEPLRYRMSPLPSTDTRTVFPCSSACSTYPAVTSVPRRSAASVTPLRTSSTMDPASSYFDVEASRFWSTTSVASIVAARRPSTSPTSFRRSRNVQASPGARESSVTSDGGSACPSAAQPSPTFTGCPGNSPLEGSSSARTCAFSSSESGAVLSIDASPPAFRFTVSVWPASAVGLFAGSPSPTCSVSSVSAPKRTRTTSRRSSAASRTVRSPSRT